VPVIALSASSRDRAYEPTGGAITIDEYRPIGLPCSGGQISPKTNRAMHGETISAPERRTSEVMSATACELTSIVD
jgi:hypothetical protein